MSRSEIEINEPVSLPSLKLPQDYHYQRLCLYDRSIDDNFQCPPVPTQMHAFFESLICKLDATIGLEGDVVKYRLPILESNIPGEIHVNLVGFKPSEFEGKLKNEVLDEWNEVLKLIDKLIPGGWKIVFYVPILPMFSSSLTGKK